MQAEADAIGAGRAATLAPNRASQGGDTTIIAYIKTGLLEYSSQVLLHELFHFFCHPVPFFFPMQV